MSSKVTIRPLSTGVPGLDDLLGGGLPEFSFNLIVGTPGSGKTTLAHQIMFSLAAPDCPALFFTVLGEPTLKMLRYQQQFSFFDQSKINQSIRYVNLASDLLEGNFDRVMARIAAELKEYDPSLVFVDSYRSLVQSVHSETRNESDLQRFVQHLGMEMSSWQATSFLIGEYQGDADESSPVFTVADGILRLTQNTHRNSMVRKMQVAKIRGQAQKPGLHTFRITDAGVHVFPRAIVQMPLQEMTGASKGRISMGVPGLDEMLGGGLPAGYSLLVAGPSGSGKTILATAFLAEGVRCGEPGVIAAFEKSPNQLLNNSLHKMASAGQVGVIDTRALDLSIDETLHDIIRMIDRMQAKRIVIDSLSGFELALAPEFSEDFQGSLYRMVAELTSKGVTILMTSELDCYSDLYFTQKGSAFLADAILVQRYVEIDGQYRRVFAIVKIRGSDHCKDIRLFEITDQGMVIGDSLPGYDGIMTGYPTRKCLPSGERA
ncbi:MAG: AAA family ATPase [Xanthomonadaceae bacterium]|nr:AAA family ATPase [Xanthomonadaceae bacterium]